MSDLGQQGNPQILEFRGMGIPQCNLVSRLVKQIKNLYVRSPVREAHIFRHLSVEL